VSTLIKWFPDRRGLATGMAIMGFGGGAMIGAPLADLLMNGGTLFSLSPIGLHYELTLPGFRTATSPGVWQTFVVLGLVYMTSMLCGAFGYRVPPTNWAPEGWTPPPTGNRMITKH
ncbi:MFS transporter, partial [Microbacteriaceae bacterium K1510]|nr:MFS transporter [Microbacteriaceae bacterium K1510]